MNIVKWVVIALLIVGGLNWGLVGAFHFNLVSTLFGDTSVITRVIYVLVGVAALVEIFLIVSKKVSV